MESKWKHQCNNFRLSVCSVITNLVIYWVICINAGCRTERRLLDTHAHDTQHTHNTHTHTHMKGGSSHLGAPVKASLNYCHGCWQWREPLRWEMCVIMYTHKLFCCTYPTTLTNTHLLHTQSSSNTDGQASCMCFNPFTGENSQAV